ncbi:unnamed protein product [Nippostrongylus brasiliensis]|uniref:Pentatricopeptide repeat-containing protein n=1 Tax=Nippostrongylus brasiliensis TaxID=27835 RepID=A0A0N4XH25_NIPBR|nr:unnamed protein product [Nippostrongylus brasiliensis]
MSFSPFDILLSSSVDDDDDDDEHDFRDSVASSAFILNPIGYPLNAVDRVIRCLKSQNLDELEAIIKETWSAIPVERCVKVVDSMRNRYLAVIKSKSYPT